MSDRFLGFESYCIYFYQPPRQKKLAAFSLKCLLLMSDADLLLVNVIDIHLLGPLTIHLHTSSLPPPRP